jgi:hypothetical protein
MITLLAIAADFMSSTLNPKPRLSVENKSFRELGEKLYDAFGVGLFSLHSWTGM